MADDGDFRDVKGLGATGWRSLRRDDGALQTRRVRRCRGRFEFKRTAGWPRKAFKTVTNHSRPDRSHTRDRILALSIAPELLVVAHGTRFAHWDLQLTTASPDPHPMYHLVAWLELLILTALDRGADLAQTYSPAFATMLRLRKRSVLKLFYFLFTTNAASTLPAAFRDPPSAAVDYVRPLIGNGGDSPNGSGGMCPSTAPPFAMTRWVAQTRANYVSVLPYNYSDTRVHGFQGTHQPAIWMGESGQVVVVPGAGKVVPGFEERGMRFSHEREVTSASYYRVEMDALEGGTIVAEQSATSRTGHLRFTFHPSSPTSHPYIYLEATRPTTLGSSSTPPNLTYPHGTVSVDPATREICGRNPELQDRIIFPTSLADGVSGWAGYFCARFDTPFAGYGVTQNGTIRDGDAEGAGAVLGAYARFPASTRVVDVRVGVSFLSTAQARANLESEVPDGTPLEATARRTRAAWAEKLDRIEVGGDVAEGEGETFYTAFFHSLQYPYEVHEYVPAGEEGEGGGVKPVYYSGYDGRVHEGESYSGYSNWDTYRAQWAWLLLFAPERAPGMVRSMLQDYREGGWLPMWKNIVETNIMVGTHADSMLAQAALLGVRGVDWGEAWAAVLKDATVPPRADGTTEYADRQENVDYEVRAGLGSVYAEKGWVADDVHSESASRTLDYAYDDYAVSRLAHHLSLSPPPSSSNSSPSHYVEYSAEYFRNASAFFHSRSLTNAFALFNPATGFMEARNGSGAWAGQGRGWTEGDMWAYTFDVVQDVRGLAERRGGEGGLVEFLDKHFDGGHNDHTNEPSHHIPYLYAMAGAASKGQARIREVARANYNNTVNGLSGNEDCGQMSAWYLFSALGFYPVDPVSLEYIVGTPFFDHLTIHLPAAPAPLTISAPRAPAHPYVKSVALNGRALAQPVIRHADFARGGRVEFEMSGAPQGWGSATLAMEAGKGKEGKEEREGHADEL